MLAGREERELNQPGIAAEGERPDDEFAERSTDEKDPPTTRADIFDAVGQARVRVRAEGADRLAADLLSKGPFAGYLRDGLAKLRELRIDIDELVCREE